MLEKLLQSLNNEDMTQEVQSTLHSVWDALKILENAKLILVVTQWAMKMCGVCTVMKRS